jgi:hypothetical protein
MFAMLLCTWPPAVKAARATARVRGAAKFAPALFIILDLRTCMRANLNVV